MKYPTLRELSTTRDMIGIFGGYNHNLRIGDGEFYDMTNLSSADYPLLSPRKKRGIYATPSNPQGLIAKDSLCYVDGSYFVINKHRIDMGGVDGLNPNTPKTLVSMGAYVVIMPDKMYINTTPKQDVDPEKEPEKAFEFGKIEASVSTSKTDYRLCDATGEAIYYTYSQTDMPKFDTDDLKDINNGVYWLQFDNSEPPKPIALKRYSAANDQWAAIDTYVRISSAGEARFDPFEAGDSIIMSGITIDDLLDLNNKPQIIVGKERDGIWVKGIVGEPFSAGGDPQSLWFFDGSITIQRKMPNMDFIIESQNRLWGCRYGKAVNGEIVNEIYASKLGDFKNWQNFAGISTDSWVGGVGTDGPFTGAINYGGYPVFFKDNCIHKVYGNYPAQYQIQTTMCRGVQKGSEKSLAIVNEILYYKSRHAICSYDGSLPQEISAMLGDVAYHGAVGGSLGNKYYISMADDNEQYHLFVCDTARGMWHREDNTEVREFCNCRGDLYFIDKEGNIKTILGSGEGVEDGPIKWMAESGIWGTDQPDKKYISRLDVRMSLNVGTRVVFLVQYDSSGQWEHLFTMMGTSLRTFSVPVKPKRCDHLRLRIEGEGEAKIYSICRTIEQGSDI